LQTIVDLPTPPFWLKTAHLIRQLLDRNLIFAQAPGSPAENTTCSAEIGRRHRQTRCHNGKVMRNDTRGFRTSSAGKKTRRRPPVVLLAFFCIAALAAVLAFLPKDEPSEVVLVKRPDTPTPLAQPVVQPTPTVLEERASGWVTIRGEAVEPTPWYSDVVTPTPRPPTPTPSFKDCVSFRWDARQVFNPSAQVLVEIYATNQCRRSVGTSDLWFAITGWRDGDMVQTVRAHLMEPIRHRRSGIIAIGLPGSIDWYDEITVEMQ
jgi:hypothetical protein